ncbi:MAG TPA: hypothetical protein VFS43_36580 [Polyangiaceae bacterium]|nr:hypothetical protein [Polyangiaceae bacterium]
MRVAFVLIGLLAGCEGVLGEGGARVATPPGSEPEPESVEPAPSGAPAVPLPPAPPGANPDDVKLVSSICASAYVRSATGNVVVGCRSHPPFDRPEQRPDGTLPPYEGDPMKLCSLNATYRGAFTRAGAKQAVLSFGVCHDDGDGFARDGAGSESVVLVEEVGGRWTSVGYEAGVPAYSCHRSRRTDGRDVLLCKGSAAAAGRGDMTYLFALDFARPGKHVGAFAWMFSDLFDCDSFERAGRRLPKGLVSLRVTRVEAADLDGDGGGDLVVNVERARAAPGVALDAKARAACVRNPKADGTALVPALQKTRLEFLNRGDAVVPSPASKQELDAWEAEAPEGMNGLKASAPPPLAR